MKAVAPLAAISLAVALVAALPGRPATAAATAVTVAEVCASSSHSGLAARISEGIEAARRGRASFVAVEVDDPGAGVVCRLDSAAHFDSASVVKVTILGALLRDAQAALALMADVTPSQRWGVPAGAPKSLVVHVKNGWLPLAPYAWRINSLGGFTARSSQHSGEDYSIVVLTQGNPTMSYGVTTVERIAEAVNRDLNPGPRARVPAAGVPPSEETPDETVPAGAG